MTSAEDPKTPAMPAEEERHEPFLRRWSRRKHEAHAAQDPPPPAPAVEPAPEPPPRVLTDADMPPIESLNEKSDFSVFMSAGVSEELRRRALRKLFTLPEINQRCPLDGEWYDCHGYEPLGDIITHDMREEMERAAQKLKESAVAALRDGESKAPAPAAVPAPSPAPEASGAPIPTNQPEDDA